jgi:hypothetical protein
MKRSLTLVVAAAVACAMTALIVSHRLNSRNEAELNAQRAAWQKEKADLEAALENAGRPARVSTVPAASALAPTVATPAKATPANLIARLTALKASAGPNQSRLARRAIHALEELIAAGPDALPAIREFLARNEDLDLPGGQSKGGRGSVPNDFVVPPSLRFALFDVAKQIGGADAEKLLADTLTTTGRGVELAWLARALQDMAPNKYREAALTAARELLGRPLAADPNSPLDRNDRDNLFSVLAMYGDASYTAKAQEQLIQPNGGLDRGALNYLQQTLGQQAVAIAAQMWNDPRLEDPAKREPLARLALNYVGVDPVANEFYQKAINDLTLTKNHRSNLIEDLNQDGFPDTKNLTARDLPLIQNRITLIEQLAPGATDPVNVAAFKEAYKDLLKMRERVERPPQPKP